jgi:hypothetical protein
MTPFDLPEWAKREEKYQAKADRDAFISRSFLRMLGVAGRLREMGARREPVLPSAAAVLFLVFWLIMTALARTGTFLMMQAALVMALSGHAGRAAAAAHHRCGPVRRGLLGSAGTARRLALGELALASPAGQGLL